MVPQVKDIAASGTARLVLRPLLPVAPGFGAVLVSLVKAPRVRWAPAASAAAAGRSCLPCD
jgi:hypothetical protein